MYSFFRLFVHSTSQHKVEGLPGDGVKDGPVGVVPCICTLCNSIMKLNCSYECNWFRFLGVFYLGGGESLRLGTALGLKEGNSIINFQFLGCFLGRKSIRFKSKLRGGGGA